MSPLRRRKFGESDFDDGPAGYTLHDRRTGGEVARVERSWEGTFVGWYLSIGGKRRGFFYSLGDAIKAAGSRLA